MSRDVADTSPPEGYFNSSFEASIRRPLSDDRSRLRFAVDAFSTMCRHFSTQCHADAAHILSAFHSVAEPAIGLADYMERLDKGTGCGEEAVLLGIIIAARYCAKMTMLPSLLSMHRLLLVGTRIATKAHHDSFRSNRAYARGGGLTLKEINELEVLMLVRLEYRIIVDDVELNTLRDCMRSLRERSVATGVTRAAAAEAVASALRLSVSPAKRDLPLFGNVASTSAPLTSPTEFPATEASSALTSPLYPMSSHPSALRRRSSTELGLTTGNGPLAREWRRDSTQSVASTQRTGSVDLSNTASTAFDELTASSSTQTDSTATVGVAASWRD